MLGLRLGMCCAAALPLCAFKACFQWSASWALSPPMCASCHGRFLSTFHAHRSWLLAAAGQMLLIACLSRADQAGLSWKPRNQWYWCLAQAVGTSLVKVGHNHHHATSYIIMQLFH